MHEISVIVPCHNSMPYIKGVVDTLSGQTFNDFELLFIDDGSTDGTLEYLREVASEREDVFVHQNSIQGAGASRNMGLSLASGRFVIFLDSDDLFNSELLERLYCSVIDNSSDMAICEYESFKDDPKETVVVNSMKGYPAVISPTSLDLKLIMLFDSAPWNKLIRKQLLLENGIQFQNCKHANDLYAIYSAIFSSSTISLVSMPLVKYRTGRAGSIQGKIAKNPTEILVPYKQLILDCNEVTDSKSDLVFKTFLMNYRSNFNNMGDDTASGKLWDAVRDDEQLLSWLKLHSSKIRLWEDALFYCTVRLPFFDFCKQTGSCNSFLKKILPKRFKKYALLFSAVFYYIVHKK